MLAIWSLLEQMLFSTDFSTGLCHLRFLRNASPNYARPVCGVKYVNYLNRIGYLKNPAKRSYVTLLSMKVPFSVTSET